MIGLTPLAQETRLFLPTETAGLHLSRKPQTLREWACKGNGPIKPVRVNGRLLWPVGEIKKILGV